MTGTDSARVVVGGDVFDVMTVAMYAEPLVIYRELIQNAADSIESAIKHGIVREGDGSIEIALDPPTRGVVIRDNGLGLANVDFEHQMLALGASVKRGGSFRGFRGIGRLAGVGHFKEIVFVSRSVGDRYIKEVRWDSLYVRSALAGPVVADLQTIVAGATTFRSYEATDQSEHFFEVRLMGAKRLPDDRLFSASKIQKYLSQVAPVGFAPDFKHGAAIGCEVRRRIPLLEVRLSIAGERVYKPYQDKIQIRRDRFTEIRSIEFVEIPSGGEGLAAFGWIGHTDYLGALSVESLISGLRVRNGNIQTGDGAILSCVFPEERFNAWAVGEFHVFDGRIRPNARRDAFEPSIAVDDLHNNLAPYGAAIARQCRLESRRRNVLKRAYSLCTQAKALETMLRGRRGAIMASARESLAIELMSSLGKLREAGEDLNANAWQELEKAEAVVKRMLSSSRRRAPKRVAARSRGHMDMIVWMFKSGRFDLIEPALKNIESIDA